MSEVLVFGVDCGKNKVHVVCSDGTEFSTTVEPGTSRDVALSVMAGRLEVYIEARKAKAPPGAEVRLYVEGAVVAGARNIQTTIGIAETVGMVLSLGYPATLVPISSWKQRVIGSGNATKEDVERWYRGVGGTLKGQDFYDAAAICAYGVQDVDTADKLRRGLLSGQG